MKHQTMQKSGILALPLCCPLCPAVLTACEAGVSALPLCCSLSLAVLTGGEAVRDRGQNSSEHVRCWFPCCPAWMMNECWITAEQSHCHLGCCLQPWPPTCTLITSWLVHAPVLSFVHKYPGTWKMVFSRLLWTPLLGRFLRDSALANWETGIWKLEYSCLCIPENRVLVTRLDVSSLLSLILHITCVPWDRKTVYVAFVLLHSPILVLIVANPLDKGGSFHSGVGHLSGVTHVVLHKHITNVTFDSSVWPIKIRLLNWTVCVKANQINSKERHGYYS